MGAPGRKRLGFPRQRVLHLWLSIVLALPLFVVALTGVLKAHETALRLDKVYLSASFSPQGKFAGGEQLRVMFQDATGQVWLGGKFGLMRHQGDRVYPVVKLDGNEVRGLLKVDSTLLVAAKKGLWRVEGLDAVKIKGGDFTCIARLNDGTIAASAKDNFWVSLDNGRTFGKRQFNALDSVAAATTNYTLANLNMDLHSGRTFFGKNHSWIWIDLLGLDMILITVTGLVIWLQSRRRRPSVAANNSTGEMKGGSKNAG